MTVILVTADEISLLELVDETVQLTPNLIDLLKCSENRLLVIRQEGLVHSRST